MPRTPSTRSAARLAFHFSANEETSPVSVTMPSSTATPIFRASMLGSYSSSATTSRRSSSSDFIALALLSPACLVLVVDMRLRLAHRLDLRLHLHLGADHEAAGLQRLVPVDAPPGSVELALRREDQPLVAPGIRGEALVLAVDADRMRLPRMVRSPPAWNLP